VAQYVKNKLENWKNGCKTVKLKAKLGENIKFPVCSPAILTAKSLSDFDLEDIIGKH